MTDPHFKKQALLNLLHPLPSSPTFNFLSSCFLVELALFPTITFYAKRYLPPPSRVPFAHNLNDPV